MIEQTAAVAAGGANSVRGQVQARPCLLFHCRKEDLLQNVYIPSTIKTKKDLLKMYLFQVI